MRYDPDGGTIADLPVALRDLGVDVSVLVVTTAGLGTLNTTALTVEALRTRRLPLYGLVIGSWPAAPDLASRCNLTDLPGVANAPLLGALPERCAKHDREGFLPIARASLAPELGGTWSHAAFLAKHAEASHSLQSAHAVEEAPEHSRHRVRARGLDRWTELV